MAVIRMPGRAPSADTECAGTLILELPVSRTVRNERLLFKLLSLCYFVMAAQADQDTSKQSFVTREKPQA